VRNPQRVLADLTLCPPPQEGCKVLWWVCLFVCLSVCLSVCSHISETTWTNFDKFCACCLWPWIGPLPMALRYDMYFRFCGWRHVSRCSLCSASCIFLGSERITAKTTASTPTKCAQRQRSATTPGAKSATYDCLVIMVFRYEKTLKKMPLPIKCSVGHMGRGSFQLTHIGWPLYY